ncbi:hypothetical protein [Noviherbaspirillum sedimenti]|uniref:hypothetical protein n=1 Tax=Noviherbaspirillum sedimenti TaxID=2320865 RepID=UPI001314EB72|nr:hypothetical protein [Noviherbaspirillum sedimenti]
MATYIHLKSCVIGLFGLFGLAGLAAVLAAPARIAVAADLGRGFIRPASMSFEQVFGQIDRGGSGLAADYFGVGGLGVRLDRAAVAADIAAPPALVNPYFVLAPNSAHVGISRELGGVRIKFGILGSGLAHSMALRAFDPDALSPALMTVQPRINARVLEFSYAFDRAALSFSLMRSKERNPWPGSRRTVSAFSLGAPTSSAQLTGVWLLAPKIALAAQASYGRSPGGSGLAGDTVRSNAFSVGLVASDRYRTGDRFSLTLSQPIRTYHGLREREATGVAMGAPAVVANGRELLAEMNYVAPLGQAAYAGWAVSLRRHPDNVAAAPSEKLLALRYVQQF